MRFGLDRSSSLVNVLNKHRGIPRAGLVVVICPRQVYLHFSHARCDTDETQDCFMCVFLIDGYPRYNTT